ncbi:MAG TPA: DASS family sodium-coupled anion symporter [Candidatus Aminicenantes bacterium]|nr:DASS family sodium-coupled anion symporter [Candidatus Aminicenantes bacterium]
MAEMTQGRDAAAAAQSGLDDLLDLDKHKLAQVPERKANATERWMKYLGFPLGIAVFLLIFYMPLPAGLTASGQAVLACFALALVWWVCEPVPTYLTSLILMLALVFTDGWDQEHVLGVLGFDVIWLNVMAFVLSSILVKTALAKRLALNLIIRFGHNASKMLLAFIVLQLCLAPLIPATAPRAVMTLPLMLVVAAIYGSTSDKVNGFGRNLFLQNLLGVNIFSSGFMTGSTANLIAISLIMSLSGEKVFYTDWMFANLPVVLVTMLLAWFFGPRLLIRLKPEERRPVIPGGIETLKRQLERMGRISFNEKKAAAIFGLVIFLWITDRFHMAWFGFEINPVMAAMAGAIITFLPKVGIIKWNEADIPWHLMLFSAGAYAGGLALDNSGAARWAIGNLFRHLDVGPGTNFWVVYVIVIAANMYAHIFFTSKTMRVIIMMPIVIAVAQQLGFPVLALALPAAFTTDWVITLPINAKPNVIYFSTGQFSVLDNIKYGFVVSTLGIIILTIAGMTWFRFLGITP